MNEKFRVGTTSRNFHKPISEACVQLSSFRIVKIMVHILLICEVLDNINDTSGKQHGHLNSSNNVVYFILSISREFFGKQVCRDSVSYQEEDIVLHTKTKIKVRKKAHPDLV